MLYNEDFNIVWNSKQDVFFLFISGSNKEEARDSKTEARTTQQANQRTEGKTADLQSVHLNRLTQTVA